MPERRRKYTPEFKDEAAKMVIETSRPIAEVAREIGVNEGTRACCSGWRPGAPGQSPECFKSGRQCHESFTTRLGHIWTS